MAKIFFKRMILSFFVVLAVIAGATMLLDKADFVEGTLSSSTAAIGPETPPTQNPAHVWTAEQKKVMESLWLGNLPPLPPDPSNAVADNETAADLGHKLFFDTRLSANGEVSCASCHQPELMFTDGLPRGQGIGQTPRATMPIASVAYSDWFFWDGRADSMWAQALGPSENPVEHGGNRSLFVHILFEDEAYRRDYEALFGEMPDLSDPERFPRQAAPLDDPSLRNAWGAMSEDDRDSVNRIFANMGKAIAAYQRLIMPGPSRFDEYVEAVSNNDRSAMQQLFSESEANGLGLFIGRANCIDCHNGPLLTNNAFHNTGVPPEPDLPPDMGRLEGIQLAKKDPFNCLGEYSDAEPRECAHMRFARTEGEDLVAAFKVPSLRSVNRARPFYMHSGQFASLQEVIMHYSHAPAAVRGVSDISPLHLRPPERQALVDFLRTLDAPPATPQEFLVSPWESE